MSAEEVLRPWLRHERGCMARYGTLTDNACSCGLRAALVSLVPAVPEGRPVVESCPVAMGNCWSPRCADGCDWCRPGSPGEPPDRLASLPAVPSEEPPPFGSVPFGTMFVPGDAFIHGDNEWHEFPGPLTLPPRPPATRSETEEVNDGD